MAEQWIPAHKALEIVKNEVAIVSALRSGSIKANAALISATDLRYARNPVRADFWEFHRNSNFTADWQAGHFSNICDQTIEVHVNGVTIELTGILKMINADERGLVARSLSVAGNPDWLSSLEARRLCYAVVNPISAATWLLEQARLGFVSARAVKAEMKRAISDDHCIWAEREWDIPVWFWESFTKQLESHQNWETGRFSGRGRAPDGSGEMVLSGVYFHAQTLRLLIGQEDHRPDNEPRAADEPERRGRKPQYDWPAAVSAIWGKLYRNELLPLPRTQADIERAMIEVLRVGDKEPSESTVRPYAKCIFEELEKP